MSIAFSVLLLGLDNAGKTCLIYPLKNNIYRDMCDIRPTAGFEMHTIQIDRMDKQILVYDCSGNGRHRSNWSIFYQESDAIIYVIDSCDAERLSIVKDQLNRILKDECNIFKC